MRRREREKGVEREKTRKSVRPSVRPRDGCWVWRAGGCGVCMYVYTYIRMYMCMCVCVCIPGGRGRAGGGRGNQEGALGPAEEGKKWGKSGERGDEIRVEPRGEEGTRGRGTRGGKGPGGKNEPVVVFVHGKGIVII